MIFSFYLKKKGYATLMHMELWKKAKLLVHHVREDTVKRESTGA